ncbi:deaminase domain-containing protein [Paenibacillus sp. FSL R7-0302]|uniref:deaminase domain-containing protein n=1 Tax=Paenibacillus sp. FSL R7-0302 TaxID=2921681 RepID=UPI0030F74F44
MASTKLVFNEDEVRRLQTKIGQVSQDTNRLYLQLKGQSSGWGGIPMGDHLVKAQVLINELTVEAEKLEDIIRVALRGVSELQEENKREADKLTGQFNLLLAAFGSLGLQPAAGRFSIPEFVQRSATNLITSIAALPRKDELSRDPVVQQLRNVIQTSGLLTVESIAAQSKLNDIFAARNQIAKAQMAFKVYQAFGNQAQMKTVHAKAEEARQKLASLDVAKIYYEPGKDLSAHYKQPAVTACEHDPSITAEKVPLLHNEEYLLLLRLAMEKTAAGAYARSQLAAKRQEIQIAAALKQVQEQIEAERRLNGPPLTLPDSTPITADNKENETTWDFYQAKVYVPNESLTPMYTSYLGWLEDTYGLTKWESRVRQADTVVLAFTEGLVKEVVMGVAGTATFAFKLVVDPVKTTTDMKNQAKYLIDHPEVLVEAAKMAYHQFDEGTPEEKAKMLGAVASILVPGLQVTKAGKVGKVLGEVEEVVSQAAKDALQGIRQKLPDLGPVVLTPEGFVFKIGEIPDTPALPKTLVQQKYMDAVDGGGGRVEGTSKDKISNELIDSLYERTQNIRNDINKEIEKIRNSDEYMNLSNTQRKKLDRKLDNLNFGNVAVADVNIPGIKKEFQAHSQIHSSDGVGSNVGDLSYAKVDKSLESYVDDQFPRFNDTEAKILEDIASQIKDPNVKGQIDLFTELDACQSCSNLIMEFRRKFPNIQLNVNSKSMR